MTKMPTDPEAIAPAAPSRPKSGSLSRAQRVAILKALADPHRYELLERVARCDSTLNCTDVRCGLQISPATLSHHIKELQTAGLIEVRREGKYHFLSLRPGVLTALIEALSALNCGAGQQSPR